MSVRSRLNRRRLYNRQVNEMTGRLNLTVAQTAFVEQSTLTATQKNAAANQLESCIFSNLTSAALKLPFFISEKTNEQGIKKFSCLKRIKSAIDNDVFYYVLNEQAYKI